MVPRYETIRQLYMEKLSGVISEADGDRLAHWLASDQKAQAVWQSLENERKQMGVDDFIDGLEPVYSLKQAKRRVPAKRSLSLRPNWRYAAVAALLIVGFFVFRFREQTAPMEFPVAAVSSEGVQLLIEDGQAIDLDVSGQGGVRSIGDMQIRIAGDELQSVHAERVVMSTLVVPPKLSYKVVLSDGSKIWLNSGSELRFPSRFDGVIREVSLVGEGYFEVATDKEKPFIVRAGGTAVQVLGTQFNVSSYEKEPVRTALVEGIVKVSVAHEEPVVLRPGFMAQFDGDGLKQVAFDASETMAWMDGIHYFNNASLDELALVINRWYGLSVVLADGRLTRHRISGLLERQDISYFLSDLQASTGISHRIENGTLTFQL